MKLIAQTTQAEDAGDRTSYILKSGATVFDFITEVEALTPLIRESNAHAVIDGLIREWDLARHKGDTEQSFKEFLVSRHVLTINSIQAVMDFPVFMFREEEGRVIVEGSGYWKRVHESVLHLTSVEVEHHTEVESVKPKLTYTMFQSGDTGLSAEDLCSYVESCPSCFPENRLRKLCEQLSLDSEMQDKFLSGVPLKEIIASATEHIASGYPKWEEHKDSVQIDLSTLDMN